MDFFIFFSVYMKGTMVANTLAKKLVAAVVLVVVTHTVQRWVASDK